MGTRKKKQVVYDFINHVGLDYMSKVKAISADMNSDFVEVFKERCPHLDIVYDHFHIVKNFNDKVISRIRINEYKRLLAEGVEEDVKKLKKVKYILKSYKATLIDKDNKAINYNKDLNEQPNTLLKKRALPKANYNFARYMDLIKNNKLFLVCDTIKEELKYAYKSSCKLGHKGNSKIKKFLEFASRTDDVADPWYTDRFYITYNDVLEGCNAFYEYLEQNKMI